MTMQMQAKIIRLPTRRHNTERQVIAEIRALRRELAELRRQVVALTPPPPWGLGDRP